MHNDVTNNVTTDANSLVVNPQSLIASDMPMGFATVRSLWATEWVQALDLLADPHGTFTAEDERVAKRAGELGIKASLVTASPATATLGLTHERAWPRDLIEATLPI